MDFITSLSISKDQNIIYILIDYFFKEKYYVLYIIVNKKTFIKVIVNILLNYIFKTYSLLNLIIFN